MKQGFVDNTAIKCVKYCVPYMEVKACTTRLLMCFIGDVVQYDGLAESGSWR